MTARSAGKKIMFFLGGSRGDVQPFVALCRGLQKAGFKVKCSANPNHMEMLRSEGIEAFSVGADFEEALTSTKSKDAMATGDFKSFLASIEEKNMQFFPEALARKLKEFEEWKPDLIMAGALDGREAMCISMAYRIPFMAAALTAATYPSAYQKTVLNEPSCFPHLMLGTLIVRMYNETQKKKMPEIYKQIPHVEDLYDTSLRSYMISVFHSPVPHLVGVSPSMVSLKKDNSEYNKTHVNLTGWWTLTREEDEQRFSSGNAQYGGSDKAKVEAFLAQGGPPVYMGWGSMMSVSREHMTLLAVRALMASGLRGIVLKGWAGLGMEALEGEKDSDALKAYAEKNVLFVKTVPQQWLFPKCSVTVHHGGAGTTAAAVRAGKPTIITPIFLDQFGHADMVAEKGVGFGTQQFGKVTPTVLADLLRKCTTDQDVIQKAREMGEKVMAEDGVGNAVRVIDNFFADEVDTGKWKVKFDKFLKKHAKVKQNPPGCGFWFSQLCCSSRPNEYDIDVDSD